MITLNSINMIMWAEQELNDDYRLKRKQYLNVLDVSMFAVGTICFIFVNAFNNKRQ